MRGRNFCASRAAMTAFIWSRNFGWHSANRSVLRCCRCASSILSLPFLPHSRAYVASIGSGRRLPASKRQQARDLPDDLQKCADRLQNLRRLLDVLESPLQLRRAVGESLLVRHQLVADISELRVFEGQDGVLHLKQDPRRLSSRIFSLVFQT